MNIGRINDRRSWKFAYWYLKIRKQLSKNFDLVRIVFERNLWCIKNFVIFLDRVLKISHDPLSLLLGGFPEMLVKRVGIFGTPNGRGASAWNVKVVILFLK